MPKYLIRELIPSKVPMPRQTPFKRFGSALVPPRAYYTGVCKSSDGLESD